MYDQVEVRFTDGSITRLFVSEDDSIQDEIVELCEQEGWDIDEVIDFAIVGAEEE